MMMETTLPLSVEKIRGDRLNPILVRVVRQELRSKAFIAIFLVLLCGAMISAMVVAAISRDGMSQRVGPGFFGLIAFGWTFAFGVAQPIACFRAISNERNDDTWDLVELTGLRPIGVVGGLLFAALVQGLLYTSALAPFMVMAYLLRGIDLLAVFFTLAIVPLGGIAACCLAVFTASLSSHKAVRATLGGLLSLGLVILWFTSAGLWFNLDSYDVAWLLEGLRTAEAEIYAITGIWLNMWAAGIALLLVLSGCLLSHRARDRSFAPRLTWWILWLNAWLWLIAPFALKTAISATEFGSIIVVMSIVTMAMAAVLGFFAVSEDREMTPRQAKSITHPPRWRKYLTWNLGPGAARGRLAFLAMATLTLLIGLLGWGITGFETRNYGLDVADCFVAMWSLFAWSAIVLVVSEYLTRGPCQTWFDTAVLRRGFTLLLVAMWSLLPPLGAWLLGSEIEDTWTAFLSPVTTFFQIGNEGIDAVPLAFAVFSAIGAFAIVALFVQGLNLHITTARVLARDGDHNPRGG